MSPPNIDMLVQAHKEAESELTVVITADSEEYRSRRYSSLKDIAKDMSIAFGVQFQIKMDPKWVLRELHRVKYSGGGNL
jgi:predicted RNA-binding protein Jag